MTVQKALIVGGGISGLTAGAALAHRGIDVDLVELKGQLGDAGGIGLSIMGNATRALATLGAAHACVAAGMPADVFTVRAPSGEVVGVPPWPPLGKPEWPAQIGISRAAFHRILTDAATQSGVHIRCGVTTQSITQGEERASVVFTDGRAGDYDLIVAADGLYSKTRAQLFPEVMGPQQTGLAIWRALAPRPEGITTTQMHFNGAQGLVGICPINDEHCYIYCMHEATPGERRDPTTLHEQLREKIQSYGGLIPGLAAQINTPTHVSYRPIEWMLVPAPWYRGRVVLIGDAAHANPPNIAQGAAMGIEDAVVLAEEVSRPGTFEEGMARFMARRWERVNLVVEASYNVAKNQVEHTPGFDAAAEIRRASTVLAQPY
jgi:2-polyprenyl-6-methoxyphenol hydroxylase-like FAD-dependent oxidoreductase